MTANIKKTLTVRLLPSSTGRSMNCYYRERNRQRWNCYWYQYLYLKNCSWSAKTYQ